MNERELTSPRVGRIAEIVHDIDLKDGKFGRQETPGIEQLIAGIAMAHKDDDETFGTGMPLFLTTCTNISKEKSGRSENRAKEDISVSMYRQQSFKFIVFAIAMLGLSTTFVMNNELKSSRGQRIDPERWSTTFLMRP